jgi:hypothetical protein
MGRGCHTVRRLYKRAVVKLTMPASAIVPPPALAVALGAAASCWDALPHLGGHLTAATLASQVA